MDYDFRKVARETQHEDVKMFFHRENRLHRHHKRAAPSP